MIKGHEPLQKSEGVFAHIDEVACSHLECPRLDLAHDISDIVAIERWPSRKHYVEDDASGPDVALEVIMIVQHVWRDVVWCSLLLLDVLAVLQFLGETKIDELDAFLDVTLFDEDQVLRLDVTMHDAHAVEVVEYAKQLLNYLPCIVLVNPTRTFMIVWLNASLYPLVKLATLIQICDQVEAFVVLEPFENTHDARMV